MLFFKVILKAFFIFCSISISLFAQTTNSNFYVARDAVAYSDLWAGDYYNSYNKYDNDCANFVSQCLKAGGCVLTANPQTYSSNGQQVSIYRDDKGCIINCDHLNAWLSSHSDPVEPYYTQIAQPSSKILAGDVIIFGFYLGDQYHHATFVASGSGYNVELNAHTNARYHYPITFFLGPNATEGQYTEMTCYHISTTGAVVTPPPSEPHYGTGCGFYPTQPYIHEKQ